MPNRLLTPSLIRLDATFGDTKHDVIEQLAAVVAATGRASSELVLAQDIQAREEVSATGVTGGVALPHCRSAVVREPTLAFARLADPVDFGGPDGGADLILLIAVPEGSDRTHLRILSKLARGLLHPEFLHQLRTAATADEVLAAVSEVLGDSAVDEDMAARRRARAAAAAPAAGPDLIRVVAVTACATGIAHTYMAADALQQSAAARDDVHLIVETQGSASNTRLDPALIEAADVIILATDIEISGRERFAGKQLIDTGVRPAVQRPDELLDRAVHRVREPGPDDPGREGSRDWLLRTRQAVMTGVSFMIPFVAAGGLLIALGLLAGGPGIAAVWPEVIAGHSLVGLPGDTVTLEETVIQLGRPGLLVYLAAALYGTGQLAMGLIVPALSGFISYGLAGRPGLAPGFIGGAVSLFLGAGFIGALVTGVLGGLIAAWVGTRKVPAGIRSLMPVLIIPLLSTAVVGLAMFWLLGRPLENLMTALTTWLGSLTGTSAMLLGMVLGLMVCLDLGGPMNKTAYLFATAGLSTGDLAAMQVMAAVMAAGMVPPIAMSAATWVRRELFTRAERENGKSAWLLGLTFVTEGAIPFAAADPLRVLPAVMAGGATAGAVSMGLGVAGQAPHGGILVLFAIEPWWGLLLSVGAGVVVTTVTVLVIKTVWPRAAVHDVPELPARPTTQV